MGAEATRDDVAPNEDASGERLATTVRRVRAHIFHGYAFAARKLLGDDAHERVLGALGPDVADSLAHPSDDWVPIDHLASYCETVFANLDEECVREASRLAVDHGLPRARRLLLTVATPHGMLRRSSDMFREYFHDGRMVAYATSPCSAVVTMYEHRFNESRLLRTLAAESMRYMLQLSGAADATEHHDDGEASTPLVVRFTWG